MGSFSFKGTTRDPRLGNPQPRIAETPSGMLNAVGLQNPGIDAVIAREIPHMAQLFHGPLVANVGGFSLEDVLCTTGIEDAIVERMALREAIARLSERERLVIDLRYFRCLTQEKTARVIGVSQVQVSRIEKKALTALRNYI